MAQHLWFRSVSRIRSAVRAKDRHAVHSPFLAEFIERVFRGKDQPEDIEVIDKIRKSMLNDDRTIEVEDHGAGSQHTKGPSRKIRDIARVAVKSRKDAAILYRAAEFMNSRNILELGTSLGITSLYLSCSPESLLTTLEGCPNTLSVAKANFKSAGRSNIKTILGPFSETLPTILEDSEKLDLIFVDGDHKEQSTIEYFEKILPYVHNDSLVVFDDIHWSPGMERAWERIKADERARVTIDIHRMGFVMFRKEMSPEHFDLRY